MKKNINSLTIETTENLVDEILFKTANTFLEDALKSIPFASLISSSIGNYKNFKILKEQKQLLAFIQEAESRNQGFIDNFFKDKNNTELGLEILGILDQTYLEHQARMIGRVTLMLKTSKIKKVDFDKFTYIITKLNNHLINEINSLYSIGKDFKKTSGYLSEYRCESSIEAISRLSNPNLDLVSFGFIKEIVGDDKLFWSSETLYERTDAFYDLYEYIFKD